MHKQNTPHLYMRVPDARIIIQMNLQTENRLHNGQAQIQSESAKVCRLWHTGTRYVRVLHFLQDGSEQQTLY